MIQTSKKTILAVLLVAIALFNILALPALAIEAETLPMEKMTIEVLSEDSTVLATFKSYEEFEIYMAGISPMYETCGTGLYQHGQFTETTETIIKTTLTNGDGTVNIYYLLHVQVTCVSCGAVMESYYLPYYI